MGGKPIQRLKIHHLIIAKMPLEDAWKVPNTGLDPKEPFREQRCVPGAEGILCSSKRSLVQEHICLRQKLVFRFVDLL